MKKKIIIMVLIITIILAVIVCEILEGNGLLIEKQLTKKELEIKDFVWQTKTEQINGENTYVFSLTNNSNFDILGMEMEYELRPNVSIDELSVFNSVVNQNLKTEDVDEIIDDIMFVSKSENLVKKGEKSNDTIFNIYIDAHHTTSTPNENQFKLMKPEKLKLLVVGKKDKVYTISYEFDKRKWEFDDEWEFSNNDEEAEDMKLNSWPKNHLTEILPRPASKYLLVTSDKSKYGVDFIVYDCSQKYFNKYIKEVKASGFNHNIIEESENYFGSYDQLGNNISIKYEKNNKLMKVSVY